MSTLSEAPWGDLPYDHKTFAEVVDDYVLIRGDLCEEYARKQLVRQHERIVAARVAEFQHNAVEMEDGYLPCNGECNGCPSCDPGLRYPERACDCSGSKDVPLRATPTPEPCRWTNGGAPACSETREERYWCEPCRERREVE